MDPAPPSRDQIVNNQRRRPLPAPEREQPTVEIPAKSAGRTYILFYFRLLIFQIENSPGP